MKKEARIEQLVDRIDHIENKLKGQTIRMKDEFYRFKELTLVECRNKLFMLLELYFEKDDEWRLQVTKIPDGEFDKIFKELETIIDKMYK